MFRAAGKFILHIQCFMAGDQNKLEIVGMGA